MSMFVLTAAMTVIIDAAVSGLREKDLRLEWQLIACACAVRRGVPTCASAQRTRIYHPFTIGVPTLITFLVTGGADSFSWNTGYQLHRRTGLSMSLSADSGGFESAGSHDVGSRTILAVAGSLSSGVVHGEPQSHIAVVVAKKEA